MTLDFFLISINLGKALINLRTIKSAHREANTSSINNVGISSLTAWAWNVISQIFVVRISAWYLKTPAVAFLELGRAQISTKVSVERNSQLSCYNEKELLSSADTIDDVFFCSQCKHFPRNHEASRSLWVENEEVNIETDLQYILFKFCILK